MGGLPNKGNPGKKGDQGDELLPGVMVDRHMFLPHQDNPGKRAIVQDKSDLNKIEVSPLIQPVRLPSDDAKNIDKEVDIDQQLNVLNNPVFYLLRHAQMSLPVEYCA